MSEPAVFVLIRDGQRRYYGDRWGGVFLFRDLIWGPDDFETWVTRQCELDEFEGDMVGGAVVNYDTKRLVWCDSGDQISVPAKRAAFERLLAAAWPGFQIVYSQYGSSDLAEAAGVEVNAYEEDEYDNRVESITEAARQYEDDDDLDDDEEDQPTFEAEEQRAWVTLIDQDGSLRQRHLDSLPQELLHNQDRISKISGLEPATVPPEAVVIEGCWIDVPQQKLGLWGDSRLAERLGKVRQAWEGWDVIWADGGYAQHCETTKSPGVPLSEAKALAGILPIVLSTKRFDLSTVISAVGGGFKKFAMKATGCLVFVICLPLLIFGALTGEWTAVLITCGVIALLAVILFKYFEYRMRRTFFGKIGYQPEETDDVPPVAGPLETPARRERVDRLLAAAGLPPLREIEPIFEKCELD